MADRLDFQKLSFGVRRMGWIRFWIQVVLGIVVVGVLLFNNIGGSLARNSERAVGLGPGLSLTSLAFLVLLFSLWQGWLPMASPNCAADLLLILKKSCDACPRL